jgi:serine/threonine protein kinase
MENTRLDNVPGPRPADTVRNGASPGPDLFAEPRTLGDYRILRRLGEGGTGVVYLGYDEAHNLHVALKVLDDNLASNQGYVDRFYREAKSGALLDHPNIVRFLSVGQDRASGKHYLVREYVDGPSAHALLDAHGPLSVGDAVHIALDIARALEHAHSRNVIHRDIKPDNILLNAAGLAKLADLGLAKRTDEASHLTAARQGFGTTPYMPYEQAINAKYADARSDIYALGVTLYHLVTGTVPFPGSNHLEVVERKNQGDFLPASYQRPGIPAALDMILERMLARQPRDRYQTASELIIDLERSHLAAEVPSFADEASARNDPWVRACLASSAEPTRLAAPVVPSAAQAPPGNPSINGSAKKQAGQWLIRYRNRTGQVRKARATTQQLLDRLQARRIPLSVRAARAGQSHFRPLSAYPEFRAFTDGSHADGESAVSEIPARRLGTLALLAVAGALLLLGLVVGTVLLLAF